MRHLFPAKGTLAVFAVVSLTCGSLASFSGLHDLAIATIVIPVFTFSAWMGMRGSGQWASLSRPSYVIPCGRSDKVEDETPL